MAFLRWIIGFAIAIIIAAFAVLNLEPASLTWSPFHAPLDLPLYVIGLGMMALGFLTGAFIVWLNTDPLHLKERRQRKKIKNLEKTLKTLHEEDEDKAPDELIPALSAQKK